MSLRVYISDADEGGTHGDNVKQSIIDGYGSDISAQINLVKSALYSVQQVKDDMLIAYNAGYELFVSSAYAGSNFLNEAISYYPQMLCVFPNGNNNHIQNGNYMIPEIAVITGAGDLANETGFPIEFFAPDPITGEPDYSSFGNGVVGGQLLKIKDGRGSYWTDAVQSARATASHLGIIDINDGYGLINVIDAIAYSGKIKLTVGTITTNRTSGFSTTETLGRIIDSTSYEIRIKDRQKNLITTLTTTSLTKDYTLPSYGMFYVDYRGLTTDLTSDWSIEDVIKYNKIDILKVIT